MVDTGDLKSPEPKSSYRFKSGLRQKGVSIKDIPFCYLNGLETKLCRANNEETRTGCPHQQLRRPSAQIQEVSERKASPVSGKKRLHGKEAFFVKESFDSVDDIRSTSFRDCL